MKTRVSAKGHIVLPAEIRKMDDIEPGQEFEVERIARGVYRLESGLSHVPTKVLWTGYSRARKKASLCQSNRNPRRNFGTGST